MSVLAIDGPSGAGKTTVSCAVADRLGFVRLDTGALYRAATVAVLHAGADVADANACIGVIECSKIDYLSDGTVLLDGLDVTAEVRGPRATAAVSVLSAHRQVRERLVAQQRRVASTGNWVVEGRDIGTVVFPNAPLKVFLTASVHERARRRSCQDGRTDIEVVSAEIALRDSLDSKRETSPLRPAPDASVIDTTEIPTQGVVDQIVKLWTQLGGVSAGGL